MAYLETALTYALGHHAGLIALVGSRIYPMMVPQGAALPAVTYQRISGERIHAMVDDPGLASPRIQVDAWGSTYSSAKAVAAQVIDCLQRWSGVVETVTVQDTYFQGDQDLYDQETERWQVSMDFIIWHLE